MIFTSKLGARFTWFFLLLLLTQYYNTTDFLHVLGLNTRVVNFLGSGPLITRAKRLSFKIKIKWLVILCWNPTRLSRVCLKKRERRWCLPLLGTDPLSVSNLSRPQASIPPFPMPPSYIPQTQLYFLLMNRLRSVCMCCSYTYICYCTNMVIYLYTHIYEYTTNNMYIYMYNYTYKYSSICP